MDKLSFNELYDIDDTASYIMNNGYKRVALQFPDHLLNVSVAVTSALKAELSKKSQLVDLIKLYVLADTTYGSCCADEVAAAHVNAECIVHYGHTCFSQMSKLPVWYVFGKATINVDNFVQQLIIHVKKHERRVLVLFDSAYGHALKDIERRIVECQLDCGGDPSGIVLASISNRERHPTMHLNFSTDHTGDRCTDFNTYSCRSETQSTESFSFGGISWTLPQGCKMEDVEIVWLGDEGPALTNIMLTFNASTITIYDAERNVLVVDVKKQTKFLMRRYYLVERAKDANIVGIVVGTLGVAGYLEMVQDLKALLKQSGKKSYVLSMGKPNPAKLANFPECDIFVLVACPQTALLDSKDYMVPVITPFEAIIAWQRGRQLTGEYLLDLRSLRKTLNTESDDAQPLRAIQSYDKGEARFSFIKGSYIEDNITDQSDDGDHSSDSLALTKAAEYALQMQKGRNPMSVDMRPQVQSGVEFFALRSFQGLELDDNHQKPIEHYTVGQRGRSVAYANEPAKDLGYGA